MMTELPLEIWLIIFDHLSYSNLKKCMQLSKGFRDILNHQSLDSKLFREQPLSSVTDEIAKIHVHPLFRHLDFLCGQSLDDIAVYREPSTELTYGYQQPFLFHSAIREMATSPAMTIVLVEYDYQSSGDFAIVEAHNEDGVTVLDVIRALSEFLCEPLPDEFARSYDIMDPDAPKTIAEYRHAECEQVLYSRISWIHDEAAKEKKMAQTPLFSVKWRGLGMSRGF